MGWRARGALPAVATVLALATASGCGGADEGTVETVASGAGFDEPTGLAFRPGADAELWVTNRGDDSIAIVAGADGEAGVENRRDAYAEHFVARPSGISFDSSGQFFGISNESNNEVRGIDFELHPERNLHFKDNNFMGPTLFSATTYALAGQSKAYREDWPQPGEDDSDHGHDPPPTTPRAQCPDQYWSPAAGGCVWPREGSHLDMLHGSPLSAGILHRTANEYLVLDGCGGRTAANRCRGDGHLALYDFNLDHQEGNGFHGDGLIKRYVDAPFERVEGVPSGIVEWDGLVYYADTGAGVVRRLDLDAGRTAVLVGSWHPGEVSHHQQGTGIIGWEEAPHGPADGDDPAEVDRWIARHGDRRLIVAQGRSWIKPQETLAQYAYVRGAVGEVAIERGVVERPAGLAASERALYVADDADGEIHVFSWEGMEAQGVLETGAERLGGLALGPEPEKWLYFTDTADDSVGRVALE